MKKAIIVGASSGIGKGIAKVLAENGYKVGITGRKKELLDELKKEKPDFFLTKVFDVTDTNNTIEKLEKLVLELEGLDLLIFKFRNWKI